MKEKDMVALQVALRELVRKKYPYVHLDLVHGYEGPEVRLRFDIFSAIAIDPVDVAKSRGNPSAFVGRLWVQIRQAVERMSDTVQTEDIAKMAETIKRLHALLVEDGKRSET